MKLNPKIKTKAQRAADKAFVDKLKSLTFGVGAKPAGDVKCPGCGKPAKLVGVGIVHLKAKPMFGEN